MLDLDRLQDFDRALAAICRKPVREAPKQGKTLPREVEAA